LIGARISIRPAPRSGSNSAGRPAKIATAPPQGQSNLLSTSLSWRAERLRREVELLAVRPAECLARAVARFQRHRQDVAGTGRERPGGKSKSSPTGPFGPGTDAAAAPGAGISGSMPFDMTADLA